MKDIFLKKDPFLYMIPSDWESILLPILNREIYSINWSQIQQRMKEHGIDPSEYTITYQIFVEDSFPEKLVFFLKKACIPTNEFIRMHDYQHLSVWVPVCSSSDAVPSGVILKKTNEKPSGTYCIRREYIQTEKYTSTDQDIYPSPIFQMVTHFSLGHIVIDDIQPKFKPKEGKRVVLVESDNPWFINKENTKQNKIPYYEPQPREPYKINEHAKFKSFKILDPLKHHLGLGYSQRSSLRSLCKQKIEGFTSSKKQYDFFLYCLLALLVFLILQSK